MSTTITPTVFYRTLNVEELEIFYREAGPRDAPTVLLLHGFPSSSHMFRNLIPMLADEYHVVAPDFPGYGESSAPSVNDFEYSFERLATVTEKFTEKLNLSSYALYVSDIGASVGFRLAVMHPERVTAMIVQNGDAHDEALNKKFAKGLFDYWEDRSEKNAQVLLDWLLTGIMDGLAIQASTDELQPVVPVLGQSLNTAGYSSGACQVIVFEFPSCQQVVDNTQAQFAPIAHGDGNGSIEFDNRRPLDNRRL